MDDDAQARAVPSTSIEMSLWVSSGDGSRAEEAWSVQHPDMGLEWSQMLHDAIDREVEAAREQPTSLLVVCFQATRLLSLGWGADVWDRLSASAIDVTLVFHPDEALFSPLEDEADTGVPGFELETQLRVVSHSPAQKPAVFSGAPHETLLVSALDETGRRQVESGSGCDLEGALRLRARGTGLFFDHEAVARLSDAHAALRLEVRASGMTDVDERGRICVSRPCVHLCESLAGLLEDGDPPDVEVDEDGLLVDSQHRRLNRCPCCGAVLSALTAGSARVSFVPSVPVARAR